MNEDVKQRNNKIILCTILKRLQITDFDYLANDHTDFDQ